jgi:hypothetical protein
MKNTNFEMLAVRLYSEADKKLYFQVRDLVAQDIGGEIQARQLFKALAMAYLQTKKLPKVAS